MNNIKEIMVAITTLIVVAIATGLPTFAIYSLGAGIYSLFSEITMNDFIYNAQLPAMMVALFTFFYTFFFMIGRSKN